MLDSKRAGSPLGRVTKARRTQPPREDRISEAEGEPRSGESEGTYVSSHQDACSQVDREKPTVDTSSQGQESGSDTIQSQEVISSQEVVTNLKVEPCQEVIPSQVDTPSQPVTQCEKKPPCQRGSMSKGQQIPVPPHQKEQSSQKDCSTQAKSSSQSAAGSEKGAPAQTVTTSRAPSQETSTRRHDDIEQHRLDIAATERILQSQKKFLEEEEQRRAVGEESLPQVKADRDAYKQRASALEEERDNLEAEIESMRQSNAKIRAEIRDLKGWVGQYPTDQDIRRLMRDLFQKIHAFAHDHVPDYTTPIRIDRKINHSKSKFNWLEDCMPFCLKTEDEEYQINAVICLISMTWAQFHECHQAPFAGSKVCAALHNTSDLLMSSEEPGLARRWLLTTYKSFSEKNPDLISTLLEDRATALFERIKTALKKTTHFELDKGEVKDIQSIAEQAVKLTQSLLIHPSTYRIATEAPQKLQRKRAQHFSSTWQQDLDEKKVSRDGGRMQSYGTVFPGLVKVADNAGEKLEQELVVSRLLVVTDEPTYDDE